MIVKKIAAKDIAEHNTAFRIHWENHYKGDYQYYLLVDEQLENSIFAGYGVLGGGEHLVYVEPAKCVDHLLTAYKLFVECPQKLAGVLWSTNITRSEMIRDDKSLSEVIEAIEKTENCSLESISIVVEEVPDENGPKMKLAISPVLNLLIKSSTPVHAKHQDLYLKTPELVEYVENYVANLHMGQI